MVEINGFKVVETTEQVIGKVVEIVPEEAQFKIVDYRYRYQSIWFNTKYEIKTKRHLSIERCFFHVHKKTTKILALCIDKC